MVGLGVLVALIAAWTLTPLRAWIDLRHLVDMLTRLGDSPLAPLAMLAAFAIGGLLLVPVNLLVAACVIVFGPLPGAVYALLGTELSAITLYEIGRYLPMRRLREHFGARVQGLRDRLHHGIFAVALIRIVPLAPYSVVNLVAGATHISRLPYLLGTALGMLPGIVFCAVFIDRVVAAIEHPTARTYALLLLAAVAIVSVLVLLRRRLMRTLRRD